MEAAYFAFLQTDSQHPFVFRLDEPELIAHARAVLKGEVTDKVHVQGVLQMSAAPYNPHWRFHLRPNSITFFEANIEVCDANMNYIQEKFDEVGGSFLPKFRWCPWSSTLIGEVTHLLGAADLIRPEALDQFHRNRLDGFQADRSRIDSTSPENVISGKPFVEEALRVAGITPGRRKLYYIRGVGSGAQGDVVAFVPTMVWVSEALGLRDLIGISLSYNVRGLGDPQFPDWSSSEFLVIEDWSAGKILNSARAGLLLVQFAHGTAVIQALATLNQYGTDARHVGGQTFSVRTAILGEREVGERLKRDVVEVESWTLNHIIRSNVVKWYIDKLL